MSATGLDHDNTRHLRAISADLHELVKIQSAIEQLRDDDRQVLPGIAESLAEISQNTGRIAAALEAANVSAGVTEGMSTDVYATTVLGYPPISTWVGFITEADGSRWYASGVNEASHADSWSRDPDDALQFTSRAGAKRAVLLRQGAVARSS